MSEEDVESEDTIGPSELVRMSARNLPHVEVLPQIGANVYSILRRRALHHREERFGATHRAFRRAHQAMIILRSL